MMNARVCLILASVLAAAAPGAAQSGAEPEPGPRGSAQVRQEPVAVPIQLQVVIARYQGNKRVGSLPYVLSLSGGDARANARMRMNAQVLTRSADVTTPNPETKEFTPAPFYRDLGTSIDVQGAPSTKDRFGFALTVSESSFYPPEAKLGQGAIRSFQAANVVHLKDGETSEFTAATDPLTGEVVKVEVTLTVLK